MANGTIHKFGTLKVNGTLYAMPTNPVNGGNCVSYNGTSFSIEDTISGKELQWVEFNKEDGTQLLICDRCLIVGISWDSINIAGYVTGKEITIDGQKYKARLLTGSNGSSGSYGAGKANEWDQMMDAIGESNDIWHWSNMYSWCQEVYYNNSSCRSIRGCNTARDCGNGAASNAYAGIGLRLALEVLNTAPEVTPVSKDLGRCAVPPVLSVDVTDKDGDAYTGVVSLDGAQKMTFSGTSTGTHVIPISEWWSTMSKAAHTITVAVTDANHATTTHTYTVTKTNGPAAAPTITNPIMNQRRKSEFYVEFNIGADPDGDTQTLTLQTSTSQTFANAVTHSGLQKLNETTWETVATASNADISAKFRIKASGLQTGTVQYMRVVSVDAGSQVKSYSAAIKVAIGGVLEFTTIPAEWDTKPDRIDVKLNATIDSAATEELWVTNNANDAQPVWEPYTLGEYHVFTNADKTAARWATAVKLKITANTATGEISVSDIATGVL